MWFFSTMWRSVSFGAALADKQRKRITSLACWTEDLSHVAKNATQPTTYEKTLIYGYVDELFATTTTEHGFLSVHDIVTLIGPKDESNVPKTAAKEIVANSSHCHPTTPRSFLFSLHLMLTSSFDTRTVNPSTFRSPKNIAHISSSLLLCGRDFNCFLYFLDPTSTRLHWLSVLYVALLRLVAYYVRTVNVGEIMKSLIFYCCKISGVPSFNPYRSIWLMPKQCLRRAIVGLWKEVPIDSSVF
jgi:hypothetical protein